MSKSARKPAKTLAVFDLDNTLMDTLTFWATATVPVAHAIATNFGVDEKKLVDLILSAPSQFRFNDVGRLVNWLDEQGVLPRAQNAEEQHQIDMTKWALQQRWYATQKKMSVFYPEALETLQSLKSAGADVVIYTDAEASSMLRRMWFMAYNARRAGQLRTEMELLDLVDHFYAQPSIEDDQRTLRDVDVRFALAAKEKMTIWTNRVYKPAPQNLKVIMKDFGASAAKTVMVGDTHNDGGGAVPNKASFAWAHYGARIAPEVEAAARKMASTYYKYGVADIMASFDATCRPDVTLQESVKELHQHFNFRSGRGFNYAAATQDGPRRIGVRREDQSPAPLRVFAQPRSRTQRSPLGPATHLPPAP